MNNEFYNLELSFSVVESQQSLENGNIFVSTTINSYNSGL